MTHNRVLSQPGPWTCPYGSSVNDGSLTLLDALSTQATNHAMEAAALPETHVRRARMRAIRHAAPTATRCAAASAAPPVTSALFSHRETWCAARTATWRASTAAAPPARRASATPQTTDAALSAKNRASQAAAPAGKRAGGSQTSTPIAAGTMSMGATANAASPAPSASATPQTLVAAIPATSCATAAAAAEAAFSANSAFRSGNDTPCKSRMCTRTIQHDQ